MITLRAPTSDVVATVDPSRGGRIASLHVDGRGLLVERDPAVDDADQHMTWGSFPMAPWAGRIRRGRFELDGVVHELEINLAPHAIHGTVFTRAWQVDRASDHEVELSVELGWALGGTAHQLIAVDDHGVRCELTVTAGAATMPAELGWHPWFPKPLGLSFAPEAMYVRDAEGIPDGTLDVPGPPPWDDCFVNTDPVVLHYDGVDVTVSSDCDHWVVYTDPLHATCVEPQSGPPDAFTIRPRLLAPGDRLTRWMRWSWP